MVTTSRADWAERARRLREHAMSVSAADRHASVLAPPEEYAEVGFNYRMTDLQAAVGIVQLGKLDAMVSRRRELAAGYAKAIDEIEGLRLVADPPGGTTNFQSCWVEVSAEFPLSREELMAHLAAAGHLGPARHHGRAPAAGVRRTRHRGSAAAGDRAAHRQHPHPAVAPPALRVRARPGLRGSAHRGATPMTGLLVVAASGLAREVLAVESQLGRYPRIAVLDDDPDAVGQRAGRAPGGGRHRPRRRVPRPRRARLCRPGADAPCAGGAPLRARGRARRATPPCIHPQVLVPESCRIDAGSVVLARRGDDRRRPVVCPRGGDAARDAHPRRRGGRLRHPVRRGAAGGRGARRTDGVPRHVLQRAGGPERRRRRSARDGGGPDPRPPGRGDLGGRPRPARSTAVEVER